MPRKRTVLAPAIEAEIVARTARGESAQTVFHAIHGALSVPTIERRQRELRNPGAASVPPSSVPTEIADVPEVVPADTPVEALDKWIALVEKNARKAETDGNLAAVSSLAMRAVSLHEARRKAMPLPKADPNENPDMRALGEQVEKRLFALIDEHLA